MNQAVATLRSLLKELQKRGVFKDDIQLILCDLATWTDLKDYLEDQADKRHDLLGGRGRHDARLWFQAVELRLCLWIDSPVAVPALAFCEKCELNGHSGLTYVRRE